MRKRLRPPSQHDARKKVTCLGVVSASMYRPARAAVHCWFSAATENPAATFMSGGVPRACPGILGHVQRVDPRHFARLPLPVSYCFAVLGFGRRPIPLT